ncbi:MAG: hypothetical protein FWH11_05055 [Micrococcales bacterium]|nr:hypothetical protein [Micrococcales bacterium]
MAKSGPAAAVGLAVMVALGVGVVGGAWLTRSPVPDALRPGKDLSLVPVTERAYDDARTVHVTVTSEPARDLTSPTSGRVSSITCAPGDEVASGSSVLAVDGAGLLALATAVPPWRDLRVGDKGEDVAALNAELARLGFGAPVSDTVTQGTVRAYQKAAKAAGAALPTASKITASAILWLPMAQVQIGQCPAQLGDTVAVGEPLLTLVPGHGARVTALPTDAFPGERVLVVDGTLVPVGGDGEVSDPQALVVILTSNLYAEANPDEDGTRQLSVSWALADPATVLVVPPGSVVGAGTQHTCVVDVDETVHLVRVVGSALGQTFVVPDRVDDGLPAQVQAGPPSTTRCE